MGLGLLTRFAFSLLWFHKRIHAEDYYSLPPQCTFHFKLVIILVGFVHLRYSLHDRVVILIIFSLQFLFCRMKFPSDFIEAELHLLLPVL